MKIAILNIFQKLFSPAYLSSKPKAVAFVDFEHWYISLDRFYHTRPDMKAWLGELSKTYNVREIYVFADFSNQSLRAEIPKIREVTNIIIETQNASSFVTKDFTDFIMLDHIYQKALAAHDIKAFIIFSGDGHFSSVASFLKNQCGKTVGVYGVRSAVRLQLRNTASWCVEIPPEEPVTDGDQKYYDMIFNNLKYLSDNNRGERKMYPTFWGTVEAVSAYYSVDSDIVTRALRRLIERDYIFQTEEKIDAHKSIKVINVNWELAEREGIYKRPNTEAKNVLTKADSGHSEVCTDSKVKNPAARQIKAKQNNSAQSVKPVQIKENAVQNVKPVQNKANAVQTRKNAQVKNKAADDKNNADASKDTTESVKSENSVEDTVAVQNNAAVVPPKKRRRRGGRHSGKKQEISADSLIINADNEHTNGQKEQAE